MKRSYIVIFIIVLSVFLFAGCGFSEKAKYERQGKKNAIQYIVDKYGFKPSVKNVECQVYNGSPIPFSTSSATGYVYVKMEYNDEIFYVFISGLYQNTDGIDNYQINEVEDAINEKLHEMVPDMIHMDCYLGNMKVSPDDSYYGMMSLKYDGNNLKEVLEDMQMSQIIVSLANSDISGITKELIDETFGSKTEILFVNYKSEEDYKKAENTTYGLTEYALSDGIEKNDAYIVEYKEF